MTDFIHIPIVLTNLKNQIVKKQYGGFLRLHPTHIHYSVEFKASEPISEDEHSLGWEDVMNCWEHIATKDSVASFELYYIQSTQGNKNPESNWRVTIFMVGVGHDIKVYFQNQDDAKKLFDQLIKWKYNS